MSQTTYTVGIMGNGGSLLYPGELLVQLSADPDITSAPMNAQAGLLTLKSFEPLLLSAVQGANVGWTFMGGNSGLSISTSWIFSVDQEFAPTPTLIAGYLALSVSGGQEQVVPILGRAAASTPASRAAGEARLELPSGPAAAAAPGADSYDSRLTLLDDSFAPSGGGGRLQATGQWVRIGVVGRRYQVSGTLTLDQPGASIPVSGGGAQMNWGVTGTQGNNSVEMSVVTGRTGNVDGSLVLNGKRYFFVGNPPASGARTTAAAKSNKSSSSGKSASSGKSSPSGKSSSAGKSSSSGKSGPSSKSSAGGGGKRGR